ncbi:uncharacterized protein LOC121730603 [Aricia agestis]|uniref:uncharacterized protein LOC121730603 n=1 Tax=Aricia agestis TaxID=91739 RepID=UPI001C202797|nr:uncharacterized protein LOC121730603 [Aricia agestis]
MSFEKMEVVNPAEKEASEVLHSLLSVERRSVDSKEAIIVAIPADQNGGGEYGESAQWHTPVMGQHSVFELGGPQNMQQHNYNGHQEQVLWQGHTIQVENGNANIQGMSASYSIEFDPGVEGGELDVDTKPKVEKKGGMKKKKKMADSDSDDDVLDNKLEDNPAQVKERLRRGCDCKDNCYRGLNPEAVYRHRLNIAELTKSEHDMYLMGITMASLANPAETSRHKVRRRLRACYVYQGRKVCLEAFLYLENVTHYQLKRIRQHVMTHGVAPRIHGNVGKKPYNTFTLDIYKHATNFLKEYLKQHAASPKDVHPSGDKKGSKTVIIQGDSRKHLFEAYKEYGEILEPGVKLMGYSTFRAFMKDQFPHVKFATKKQDLPKDMVPFRSGKCMSYDKNKDPIRIQQEKEKAEAKKAAMEAKKKEDHEREQQAQQQAQQQQVQQQQQQQQVQQVQVQQHQQMQSQGHVVIHQQQQQQQSMQQQMLVPQVSQHQQVLSQQVGGVQQVAQHMQPLGVSEDSGQQVEMAQQVIPLAVVQQPQQAYIVTPVSHFQTRVQGAWYRH